MTASTTPTPVTSDDDPAAVLARVRAALGTDPRIAELEDEVAQLRQELETAQATARDAQARLAIIQEAIHA